MNRIQVMKRGLLMVGAVLIMFLMACNQEPLIDVVSTDEQLEADVTDIENYLSENGYSDYDTIQNGIRVSILDEGSGDPIEYGDFVRYNYIGRLFDESIFDTSFADLAFRQDSLNTDSLTFELVDDEFVLDVNGFPEIEYAEYSEGYIPIYSPSRPYSPLETTHTPNGWFLINEGGFAILGFPLGTHYTMDNANLKGAGIMFLPNQVGISGITSLLITYGPQPISFEIQPDIKR